MKIYELCLRYPGRLITEDDLKEFKKIEGEFIRKGDTVDFFLMKSPEEIKRPGYMSYSEFISRYESDKILIKKLRERCIGVKQDPPLGHLVHPFKFLSTKYSEPETKNVKKPLSNYKPDIEIFNCIEKPSAGTFGYKIYFTKKRILVDKIAEAIPYEYVILGNEVEKSALFSSAFDDDEGEIYIDYREDDQDEEEYIRGFCLLVSLLKGETKKKNYSVIDLINAFMGAVYINSIEIQKTIIRLIYDNWYYFSHILYFFNKDKKEITF